VTTNVFPSRPARARFIAPGAALGLLWIEIKRNAVPWVLPLLAAAYYFDTFRTADGLPAVWTVRASVIGRDMLFDFSVFAAGLCAWVGSRERRRKATDLLETTAWAAWARQGVTFAGTLCWLLLAFLAGVAVLYVQTAFQATWGGPPLWPVFVGVVGVVTVSVIGFTTGTLFPGRFTAPLVAMAVLVPDLVGFRAAYNLTGLAGPYETHGLLSPAATPPAVDAGVFYHVLPDVSIVQVMFMGGITVALFGVLGVRVGVRLTRVVAGFLVACGVAASCTAFVLTGTAKLTAIGWEIPALHSASSDKPVSYTPDCTYASGFRVCVHPAFSGELSQVATALGPVGAEIAGLPGAPVGAAQVASAPVFTTPSSGSDAAFDATFYGSTIAGNPPVFEYNAEQVGDLVGAFGGSGPVYGAFSGGGPAFGGGGSLAGWRAGFQQGLLDSFVTGRARTLTAALQGGPASLDPAQQAVMNGLMLAVGTQPPPPLLQAPPNGSPPTETPSDISAAASRFASLPESARHAWLLTHLAALRAGHVTLAEIP
jgi:uncharacterized membrane protein YgcG